MDAGCNGCGLCLINNSIPCEYCNTLWPSIFFADTFHICPDCIKLMGPIKRVPIETNECPVCLTNSATLKLKCKHKLCGLCWHKITKTGIPKCPICRKLNYWRKY